MKLAYLLALIPALACASESLPDTLCGTGATAKCGDFLTYQTAYGRVLVDVNGVQYVSNYGAVPAGAISFSNVPAYATDGSSVLVSASFKTWVTSSGRTRLTHWDLLGGMIQ